MAAAFTIARLAGAAGVHVETVRYYQRRGLLHEPARPLGGVRRYDEGDIARLRFIRRAKRMGFSLEEIAGLLEIKGKRACEKTRRLTELKLAAVRSKIDDLQRLEADLSLLVAECEFAPRGKHCPTLEFLQREQIETVVPGISLQSPGE